jgi:hypothetical protein
MCVLVVLSSIGSYAWMQELTIVFGGLLLADPGNE